MAWFFPTTRLCSACTRNDLESVKSLATPDNVNVKGFLGWSPLHNAASSGNPDVVEHLLNPPLNADVDTLDLESHTPLMLAAGASTGETDERVKTVKILLTHKANPNAADDGKYSALQLAVLNGNRRVAALLIEAGANVNHQNLDRFTALHAAATEGDAVLVQLLLSKGANKTLKDGRGMTAVDHAKEAGHNFDELAAATPGPKADEAVVQVSKSAATKEASKDLQNEIAKELADS